MSDEDWRAGYRAGLSDAAAAIRAVVEPRHHGVALMQQAKERHIRAVEALIGDVR